MRHPIQTNTTQGAGCLVQVLAPLIGIPLGSLLGWAMCMALVGVFLGGVFLIGGLFQILEGTGLLLLLGIGVFTVWRLARHRDSLVAKVITSLAGPVGVAIGGLLVLLILLNALRLSASYRQVAAVEQFLIDLRFAVTGTLHMPPWLFCCVILLMIAIANAAHVRAVTIFLETKKRVGQFVAVLTALTSFTLFAQLPAGDLLEKRYDDVMTRFEASLRREKAAVARAAAAKAVRDEVIAMPPAGKVALQTFVTRFQRIDTPEGAEIGLAAARILDAEGLHEPPPPVGTDSGPLPRTRAEYAEAEHDLTVEELRAAEAEKGAKKIVGDVIGAFLPELGGYAGQFAGKMIDGLAERLYGPWIEHLFRPDAAFAENVDILRSSAGVTSHFDLIKFSAIVDRAESEAEQRAASKRIADERMRLRDAELGISAFDEFDERLKDIHDFVKKYPTLTDEQFQDVVTYANAVRSGKVSRYKDPMRIDYHQDRWQWVESAIAKEKALALHGIEGGLHDIDIEHRAEHPEVHPEFHPIP